MIGGHRTKLTPRARFRGRAGGGLVGHGRHKSTRTGGEWPNWLSRDDRFRLTSRKKQGFSHAQRGFWAPARMTLPQRDSRAGRSVRNAKFEADETCYPGWAFCGFLVLAGILHVLSACTAETFFSLRAETAIAFAGNSKYCGTRESHARKNCVS